MSKRLYVGNLPFATTPEALTDKFAEFGEVESVRIVTDRETGRSKGFAFIDMVNADEADKAISALNGQDFMGRNLNVSEARPREDNGGPRGPRGPRRDGGGGGGRGFGRH